MYDQNSQNGQLGISTTFYHKNQMINQNSLQNQKILKKEMAYSKKDIEILDQTLKFSGLKVGEEVDYRAVRIYEIDHIHQIYTKNQGQRLPHIVLLHGFGGNSMTYFRMFKNLRNDYQVHALDAMGVGHSTKGNFKNNFTYEETRDYFIQAIEQWRLSLKIDSFTLVGHSFGGYLAACYTQKYPDCVERLILLSPAGATQKTPEQIQEELKKRTQSGWKGKFFNFFASKVFQLRIRPSKVMGSYFLGNKFIDRIVDTRLKLEKEESQAWKAFFKEQSKKQAVGEIGFYIIFEWPLKPKHTIESIVSRMNFKKPIEFYYGQYDWMDSKGARRLQNKLENVKFGRITGADHQLIFDNPDQVCYFILYRRGN